MSWNDQRTISLDAAAAAGYYQPPVTMRAYNAPRPSIRSVIVVNQSANVDVGVCMQIAKTIPDFVVPAQLAMVLPIDGTDTIVFVFSQPSGGRQAGRIRIGVTDEKLAASSSIAPASGASGAFVVDISTTDSASEIQ
jgi:hypothetical protein